MHIQNSEALRAWLEACLSRISNAEPAALAKYVVALVKKDKEEKELYSFLLDQLDIFLHQATKLFVDLLFETLRTSNYMNFRNDPKQMDEILQGVWKSDYKQASPVSTEKTVQISRETEMNRRPFKKAKAAGVPEEKEEINTSTFYAGVPTSVLTTKSKYEKEQETPIWEKKSEKISKRCKDYDEKGYCMKGDLCCFDHGTDPVVVEGSVLNFNASDSIVSSKTLVTDNTHTQEVSPSAPPPLPPSPPPPLPPLPTAGYVPEAYNPESPGMNPPPPAPPLDYHPSYFIHNQSGVLSFHIPLHNSPSSNQMHPKPIRSRELIGVPTVPIHKSPTLRDAVPLKELPLSNKRKGPVYSRLGSRLGPPKPKKYAFESRCTLLLQKVPQHMNTINSINQHFCQFGTVTNIQVNYGDDPEAALVKFQNHFEANNAYKSAQAVMNNRFIKIFWHSNALFPPEPIKAEPSSSNDNKSEIMHTQNVFSGGSSIKVSQDKVPERSVSYSTRGSLSCRTVFNPASFVLKKADSASSLRNQKEEKKDALNKRLVLHRKMEKFLNSEIENQKLILERLTKAKDPKKKEFLKKVVQNLADNITSLQSTYRKSSQELVKFLNESQSTKNETEKELLDAEIDLYKQQNCLGSNDTASLLARVNELKQRAKALGLLDTSSSVEKSKKYPSKPVIPSDLLQIDNRTRTVLVSGIVDKETLKKHFLQFGDVEKVEEHKLGLFTVCFSSRKVAEVAFLNGKQVGNTNLILSWFENRSVPDETDNGNADEEKDDSLQFVDEDEDEEDSESRSWRR